MKTMEEINRILKANNEKQKAKFIPNLQKDIKNLQFNPDLFGFYTKNINSKRRQQGDLYKKVKSDYRTFTRLINIENRKIDKKVQELKNVQTKIIEYQNNVKEKREGYDIVQAEFRTKEEEIESKINKEERALKQIKSSNDFLQAEYNTNKKDLEQVIVETKAKLKISQDKLNLAEKSVKHFTAQIEKKTQLLNDMNNPEKLVNIRKLVEKKTKKVARKDSTIKNIDQNQNMTTIASTISNTNTNENLLTVNTTSNEVKKDKESVKNGILRKESKKKNKK
jgi:chromosome segregation ATPase